MDDKYAYSYWEDDSIVPQPNNLPKGFNNGFAFYLHFCNKVEKRANDDDAADAVVLNSYTDLFYWPHRAFEDDLGECLLHIHLYSACIPERVRYKIIDEVLGFANSLSNDAENADKKILPIVVDVVVRTLQSPAESEKEAIARALREYVDAFIGDSSGRIEEADKDEETIAYEAKTPKAVAATKSSIEAFEYVKYERPCQLHICDICQKRFSVGMMLTRLPCSHTFHGDCIVRKLVENNLNENELCPECPFPVFDECQHCQHCINRG